MRATNLSRSVWNAIADLSRRSQTPREIYFCEVTKADKEKNLIWVKDFVDVPIPMVSHVYGFAYMDTQPTGNAVDGEPVTSAQVRREDKMDTNALFKTHLICPSKGDVVVILDPWGAKRFPFCIGVLQSTGAWEVPS